MIPSLNDLATDATQLYGCTAQAHNYVDLLVSLLELVDRHGLEEGFDAEHALLLLYPLRVTLQANHDQAFDLFQAFRAYSEGTPY